MKLTRFFNLIVLTGLILIPSFTHAVSQGIQISPTNYNYEINPGSSVTGKFIISNVTDDLLNYVIELENFRSVSDEGAPVFAGTDEQTGMTTLKDWVSIATADKEGTVEPKKMKTIEFTINVPVGADPGGHYAAIFAKQVIKNAQGQTQLGLANRVGALMLVSVPGEVKKTAQITDFTYPKFVWKDPAQFTMKVKNTGTIHYDSNSKVKLTSLLGKTSEVDLGTHTIIPKFSRDFAGTWSNKYPFGKYKIVASATNGSGQLVTETATFWAIPVMIVIPIIIIVALIISLVFYLRKHLRFQP